MELREFERLSAAEDRMWWFRGLHANLIAAAGITEGVLLDAGCGTGGLLTRLRSAAPAATCLGLDLDAGACATAQRKSGCPVTVGSVELLPFAERSLDAIFSADVLCHRGVEPPRALAGFLRCLKPGGVLVLNLPAYRWLYSGHDVAVDNVRRFGRQELLALLNAAGFSRVRTRYWMSLLFPLMLLRRKLHKPAQGASDVALLPAPVEWCFTICLALERAIVKAGVPLPFGGSILATAVRP